MLSQHESHVRSELLACQAAHDLVAGEIENDIEQGQYCINANAGVTFVAPVDLQAGDKMFIRLSDGMPLVLVRNGKPIWTFPVEEQRATIPVDIQEIDEGALGEKSTRGHWANC